MKVLLSIKPEFAEKIFDGSKRFEFRRSVFKNESVETIVVYASLPISKVIGEFEIEKVLRKVLDDLWEETKDYSGISKEFYDQYFTGKEEYGMVPPQSFAYIES
jgi:predicted transcriptional regulator